MWENLLHTCWFTETMIGWIALIYEMFAWIWNWKLLNAIRMVYDGIKQEWEEMKCLVNGSTLNREEDKVTMSSWLFNAFMDKGSILTWC